MRVSPSLQGEHQFLQVIVVGGRTHGPVDLHDQTVVGHRPEVGQVGRSVGRGLEHGDGPAAAAMPMAADIEDTTMAVDVVAQGGRRADPHRQLSLTTQDSPPAT
jgi:hypothetical protein